MACVPDARLEKLSALYSPKKTTFATVDYVDVAAIGQEAPKESAYLGNLRNVDALIHVLRAFEDDAIPHVGSIDPLRDIKNVEFDLMLSDLGQVEKRLERVEKDMRKMRSAELEQEQALLNGPVAQCRFSTWATMCSAPSCAQLDCRRRACLRG